MNRAKKFFLDVASVGITAADIIIGIDVGIKFFIMIFINFMSFSILIIIVKQIKAQFKLQQIGSAKNLLRTAILLCFQSIVLTVFSLVELVDLVSVFRSISPDYLQHLHDNIVKYIVDEVLQLCIVLNSTLTLLVMKDYRDAILNFFKFLLNPFFNQSTGSNQVVPIQSSSLPITLQE